MLIRSPSFINSDGAAHLGFRRDMPHHQAVSSPAESPVRDQADFFTQPWPTRAAVMASISAFRARLWGLRSE